jgi:hypothetical protein
MRANVPFFRPILGGITIGYAKNQAARSGVVTLPTEPNHQQKQPANGCPTEAYAPALNRFASTALTANVLLLWSCFIILMCR